MFEWSNYSYYTSYVAAEYMISETSVKLDDNYDMTDFAKANILAGRA